MKPSLRIPLTVTIIVVVTGIIAFIKIASRGGAFPTTSFVVWIIASVILIGFTLWSWLKSKKN